MLDFSDFPNVTRGSAWWSPPSDKLKSIPYLYERAVSALHMLFSISKYTPLEGYAPDTHAAACIRAALVDFVGMEESLKIANHGYKISTSSSPLLHFMRLLRNYQIHIGQHQVSKERIAVEFANQQAEMDFPIIDNLQVAGFMQLDAIAKHQNYTQLDVSKMINAFDEQQRRLGAYEILRLGVLRLVSEVENVI